VNGLLRPPLIPSDLVSAADGGTLDPDESAARSEAPGPTKAGFRTGIWFGIRLRCWWCCWIPARFGAYHRVLVSRDGTGIQALRGGLDSVFLLTCHPRIPSSNATPLSPPVPSMGR
jgi:hypothetical protein